VIARSPVMLKVRRERRKAREAPAGIQVYFEETDRRFAARSRTLSITRRIVFAVLLVVTGCGQRTSGPGPAGSSSATAAPLQPPILVAPTTAAPVQVVVSPDGKPLSFAPLVKRSNPSVATIQARVVRESAFGGRRTVGRGLGTGFVYDPTGYLLTNHHVIAKANEVTVRLLDGREVNGTVVGSDKHTDIAVVKVEEKNLPALPLGDSDRLGEGPHP
jgi:serine protease Do